MNHVETLLPKVKSNLILTHDEDNELLRTIILSALDYAQTYQKIKRWGRTLPPSTSQAVVMLASHFYESRDGGTGGFFADNSRAAEQVWTAVNRLLLINRDYRF